MSYEENLRSQLLMLPKTWAAFEAHGITPETPLVLEFTFRAPSRPAAEALRSELHPYEAQLRGGEADEGRWSVEGRTGPLRLSLDGLREWVERCVTLGWRHGCTFDGFGAQIP